MTKLSDTSAVIDALGGTDAVARLVNGGKMQRVSNWRRWDHFPAHAYDALTDAACKAGIAIDPRLWRTVPAHVLHDERINA